jgi:hypothetical protein
MKRKIENLIHIYSIKLDYIIHVKNNNLNNNEYLNNVLIEAYTNIIHELKQIYNEAE